MIRQSRLNTPQRYLFQHGNAQYGAYIIRIIPTYPTTVLPINTPPLQSLVVFITVGRAYIRCQWQCLSIAVRIAKEFLTDGSSSSSTTEWIAEAAGVQTHASFPQGVDPCLHFTGQRNVPLYEFQIKCVKENNVSSSPYWAPWRVFFPFLGIA